jgi:putative peptidoglycan lipid II flippase
LLAQKKREEAGRVAGAVFAILALLTSVLVLAGVLATPILI